MNISLSKIKTNNPITNIYIGSFLLSLAIFDVFVYSFFDLNITSFLPGNLNLFFPLIIGFIGLSFIRMEYSGIKLVDNINKHINPSNFNALLTLLIIFTVLKAIPPALSWMVLDANISGDTKAACTGTGACWTYIKVWFKRFMYGMYPNELIWIHSIHKSFKPYFYVSPTSTSSSTSCFRITRNICIKYHPT